MDTETYLRMLISDLNSQTGVKLTLYGPNGVSFQNGNRSVVLDTSGTDRISIHLVRSEVQQITVLPDDSNLAASSGGAEADARSPAQWAKVLAKWLGKGKVG